MIPQGLMPQAAGYRDLWWCHIVKEPFINQYDTTTPARVAFCPLCDWHSETSEPDALFRGEHQFLGHIPKPSHG